MVNLLVKAKMERDLVRMNRQMPLYVRTAEVAVMSWR